MLALKFNANHLARHGVGNPRQNLRQRAHLSALQRLASVIVRSVAGVMGAMIGAGAEGGSDEEDKKMRLAGRIDILPRPKRRGFLRLDGNVSPRERFVRLAKARFY